MCAVWNSAWELLPKNSESPTEADDNIRAVKTATERRVRNEHETYNDATGGAEALDWRHKEGSARCWYEATEPANAPETGALAGGHLWWDSDDDELHCYDGATFQPLNAATATSTVDQSGGSAIKFKALTGVTTAGYVLVAHGLNATKIVSVSAASYNATYLCRDVWFDATNVGGALVGATTGITIKFLVFYTD